MIQFKILLLLATTILLTFQTMLRENWQNNPLIKTGYKCLSKKCPVQWSNCQSRAKCVPIVKRCMAKCRRNLNCWVICLGNQENRPSIQVGLCGHLNNCLNPVNKKSKEKFALIKKCAEKECLSQWLNCSKDSRCMPSINGCFKKCGKNQNCWFQCLPQKKNAAAIKGGICAYSSKCIENAQNEKANLTSKSIQQKQQYKLTGVLLQVEKCTLKNCPTQWMECTKDQKCIPSISACYNECTIDQTCWLACLSKKKSNKAISAAICAQSYNCLSSVTSALTNSLPKSKIVKNISTIQVVSSKIQNISMVQQVREIPVLTGAFLQVQKCTQQKCPNQWAACLKDNKCIPIIEDCLKQCQKNQSCWLSCLPTKANSAAISGAFCAYSKMCLNYVTSEKQSSNNSLAPSSSSSSSSSSTSTSTSSSANVSTSITQKVNNITKILKQMSSSPLKAQSQSQVQKSQDEQVEEDVAKIFPKVLNCTQRSCPNQWQDCTKDSKCLPSIIQCMNKCQKSEDCWMPCLGGKRSRPAIYLSICTYDNNCLSYL